jgi:hypothetical protein
MLYLTTVRPWLSLPVKTASVTEIEKQNDIILCLGEWRHQYTVVEGNRERRREDKAGIKQMFYK